MSYYEEYAAVLERGRQQKATPPKFKIGDYVRKIKGSEWEGRIVGTYSTELTPNGYCVESSTHKGSVQIYPAAALELCPIQSIVK